MKSKREKFEDLDERVLDAMIECMDKKDYDTIRDLNTVVTYLKNNQVLTPPKEESNTHDKIKNAIE